ncbi:MAG TPA: LytTR family transcriptional regulator DNA-binding domain-containing protein [Capillibacterium sp.]
MLLKLLIVDDETPARKELRYLLEEASPPEETLQIWEAKNGREALETVAAREIDAAFIDINLGDIGGINLAQELLELQKNLMIVFATAYDEYAVEAFKINALDYILKPFEAERVGLALTRILKQMENARSSAADDTLDKVARLAGGIRKLPLWQGDRVLLVDLDQIVLITTDDRNSRVCTLSGTYLSNQPLSYFEQKFANEKFMRVNRSYLVNLEHIKEILPWFNHSYLLKMKGYEKEEIVISRNKIKDFRRLFDF